MSNSNYMDNVPVKISENYRPLPIVYQLPQAIAHKLALPPNHYETAPQYQYDFQLEHILLQKLPEWRHVRQREKEARRERMQQRERQRQRLYEVQQKELLGAVSYPSTEDLSSCSSDEGETKVIKEAPSSQAVNNFHNILQPTILKPSTKISATANGGYLLAGSFNYQDFEGSSSPFDEIELKTINDLDILAQVLHNTQIKPTADKKEDEEGFEKNANSPEIEANKKELDEEVVGNIPNNINSNSSEATPTIYSPPYQHHSHQLKSVPDILNVLQEETRKSERNNCINTQSEVLVEENETTTMNKIPINKNTAESAYYSQLDETSKEMAKNISTMGFSLEQVARTALLYGANDKKIIEHLICLNELSVLGFAEEKVSNALLTCENDKEKALELLIS